MGKRKQDKVWATRTSMAQKQVRNSIKKEVEDKDNGKSNMWKHL